MSGKNTALFGIYPTHGKADAAVDALRAKGLLSTDISEPLARNIERMFRATRGQTPDSGIAGEEVRGSG